MQVDSGTQAFLETLRGMGGKPLYELTIAEAREERAKVGGGERDAGVGRQRRRR